MKKAKKEDVLPWNVRYVSDDAEVLMHNGKESNNCIWY